MKKKFLLAVVVAAAIVSCKKDKDNDTGTTPVPGVSKRLKKVTRTEDGQAVVYNLHYDDNKRLTSYTSSDNEESTSFFYDATGNLNRVEENDADFKSIYTYTYNNNIPVTGTFKSWTKNGAEPDELIEDDKLTYTVINNQVSKIHLEMLQAQASVDFMLTYANGNLKTIESEGSDIYSYTANFDFGNKKAIFPKVSNYILDQAGFSLQFAANNELLKAVYDFSGTSEDLTVTNQYTYDNNGYVLTGTDGDAQLKFEYE